jgi:hypothetical protein
LDLDLEFPKASDQNVLAFFERVFDDFEDEFGQVGGIGFGHLAILVDVFGDDVFGEGHGGLLVFEASSCKSVLDWEGCAAG